MNLSTTAFVSSSSVSQFDRKMGIMVVSSIRALSQRRKSTYLFLILIVGLVASSSGFTVLYIDLIGRGLTPQQIYGRIEPSVVTVTVKVQGQYGLVPYVQGSGFIYSGDGFIVTNYHVVRVADEVEVTFPDGTITQAEPVGADVYSDLAVIKVDPKLEDLKPLLIADSSTLRIGDSVLAIGNPYGLSGSMTKGIVSQLDRTLRTDYGYVIVGVIQTDAAINPGNSGGPLLNMRGEVVGVNSAVVSQTGDFSGVGFAIPSNLMVKVIPSLIREHRYTHPWLGLSGVDVTPSIAKVIGLNNTRGFLVTSVAEGSPARKSGLKAGNRTTIVDGQKINVGGDVIIDIDGVTVRKLEDLLVHIEYSRRPHDSVTLRIIRDSKTMSITVELGERPPAN
jgi:S1-C subfamily serine protease